MVKLLEYITYRGKGGQWAWMLHRITGLGVLLFLLVHIADIALIGWGPKVFDNFLVIYRAPFFRVSEVALAGAVLYHALNGIRITVIDFWPEATAVHKKLIYAVGLVFAGVFIPTAIYMLHDVMR